MNKIFFIGASAIAMLSANTAYAQAEQAPQAADQLDTGDIIVTATRTESLASKTPVALTAVSGDNLRSAGVTNPTALGEQVPNVAINRINGAVQVTIRGVTSTDSTEKGDPSAAFLSDGVYLARPQAQEVSFFDVARVEVLRGPQGTLYGRNTTAGLINVISNRPNFDKVSGSVDVGYGNYNAWNASGVVNAPISENVAIRAAVNYDRRDNYIIRGPLYTAKNSPFRENLAGRFSALFRWDSGDLILRGDYADVGGNTVDLLVLRNFYTATTNDVDPIYIGNQKTTDQLLTVNAPIAWDIYRNNYSWGVGGELTQEVGGLTASYIGSYRRLRRYESDARLGQDGTTAYRALWDAHYTQQSHEVRLATNGDGPLKAQVGAMYFKEKSDIALTLNTNPNTGPTGQTGSTLGFFQNPTKATSYGFFGQATYSLTPALRLTGGVRYSHDDKSRLGYNSTCIDNFSNCVAPVGALPTNNAKAAFSKVTWRAGIDFDVNDATLLYGVVSTGYKSGGFNDGCPVGGTGVGCSVAPALFNYAPENLRSYEAGVKTRLLDNALRFNLAVFHYDYTNLQLTQAFSPCPATPTNPLSTCSVTTNAAKAKIDGVEFESVIQPSRNDRFDVTVSYLNARYADFQISPTRNFKGLPLDRSPNWTVMAGYQHTFNIGDGTLVAGVRTRLVDNYYLMQIGTRNFYRQPSYTSTDATVTYNAPGKTWYLQGYLKNIENAIVVTNVQGLPSVRSWVQAADPRTYGVRAGFKF